MHSKKKKEEGFGKLKWDTRGISIDGQKLKHLCYADDIILTTNDLGEARGILQELVDARYGVGLEINFAKTKIITNLVMSDLINIGKKEIELVDIYVYLDHKIRISRDNQTCDLLRPIGLGWAAYGRLKQVFVSNGSTCQKRKVFD